MDILKCQNILFGHNSKMLGIIEIEGLSNSDIQNQKKGPAFLLHAVVFFFTISFTIKIFDLLEIFYSYIHQLLIL